MTQLGGSVVGQEKASPVDTDRLCSKCRHYIPEQEPRYRWARCNVGAEIDPIEGVKISDRVYSVRGVFGECGPEGRLWEAV